MSAQTDVLIVGGGPSGLICALALAQNDARVRVVDKLATPRLGQKGSGIQPRTIELYKFLGLLDDVQARSGYPQPLVHYKLPGGTEIEREFAMAERVEPTPDVPYSNALMLAQDRHETLLREHLARHGIHVEMSTELLDFTQDGERVHVRLAKGCDDAEKAVEELDVEFLIGADGGHSKVRKLLGLKFEGETRQMDKMVIGDIMVKPPGLDKRKWHCWGDAKSKLVMMRPSEDQDLNRLALMVGGPDIDNEKTASSREEFIKVFQEISGRSDIEFGELVTLGVFRPNIRMVDRFGEGRVFVVGDAAHTHSPTGGQGMNSCVQDAANLTWKLSLVLRGLASLSLLTTYTDERVPVIREMLGLTTRLLDRTLRPGGNNKDEGWRRGGALFMLGVHCRWSPLVVDERREPPEVDERESAYVGAKGVCAGDRAPDAPVEGGVGHLFDLFKPTHHVVLVFSKDAARVDAVVDTVAGLPKGLAEVTAVLPKEGAADGTTKATHTLMDKDGHAYKAYEVSSDPTIVVVRPDGVIGAIVKSAASVENYFRYILTYA
ncbi:FAD binding domain-containing protein [Schizophyllum commune]